jgi:hypothetical protein
LYSNVFDPRQLGEEFRTDVPAVTLPRSFFAAPLDNGLTADWNRVPVVVDGFDYNGNPRLRFALGGDASDDQALWEYFWAQCEYKGVSSRACFMDLDDVIVVVDGMILGYVEPLDFMLRNFIGTNCAFLVVDGTSLSDAGKTASLKGYIGLLQDTIPAHTRLFIIEHKAPKPECYSLEPYDAYTDYDTTTCKGYTVDALLPLCVARTASSVAAVGVPSSVKATYRDCGVRFNWVAVCK